MSPLLSFSSSQEACNFVLRGMVTMEKTQNSVLRLLLFDRKNATRTSLQLSTLLHACAFLAKVTSDVRKKQSEIRFLWTIK